MTGKSVTQNTTYLTASYVAQKILSFFYFIMVARFIGVEDLGKYTFALSFTTMFAVFVDWGLTSALIRESAKFADKAKNYLSSILGVKLIFSALIYVVVASLVNVMQYPEITRNLVYIAGFIMVIDQFTLTFWGVFRGQRNLKYEAISVVINQVIILAVGLTVLFLHLPLYYLMLPFILASTFSLLFAIGSLWRVLKLKFSFKFDKKILGLLFKISIPFALIAIFSRIYGYIDSVMLSKLVGDKAVGWYSVAMKIPFALQFIPAALAAAIFPAFSHHYLHDKEQLKYTFDRVMKFLTIIVLPISLGVAVLAKPIILFFYGQEYLPSVEPLSVMMLGLFFVFLNFPLGALLNGCDRQVTNTKLVGITMVINILLNLYLIPQYSFVGASVAFFMSHGFLFIMSLVVAKKIIPYKKRSLLKDFLKAFASATVMGLVLYLLQDNIHVMALIFVGAVIYFLSLYLVRGVKTNEIRYFIDFFLRRKVDKG